VKITRHDIDKLGKQARVNLMNSITGFKSANLIGTANTNGLSNLAVFSTVTHLGSNPPLIGMITRPTTVPRHTFANILATGHYTINHIHQSFTAAAHQCSAKYDDEVSEFKACGFSEEYVDGCRAPFVEAAVIKIGMQHKETIEIKTNGTLLIVGEVLLIHAADGVSDAEMNIDLNKAGTVTISGLNNYHNAQLIQSYGKVIPDTNFRS